VVTRVALLCAGALVLYLLAPLLVIVPVSLTDQAILSLPRAGLSLQHFERLFASEAWLHAAAQSLVIGMVSATTATVLAFLAASAVWLNRGTVGQLVAALIVLPMVVPTIVTALGLHRLFVATGLRDTYAGVMLAHTIVGLPYAFVLCLAGLSALRPTLFYTARSMGAGPLRALALVVLPLMRGAVAGGWIFAFLHSWDELVITLFISSRTINTLPRVMWDGMNDDLDPLIAAVSVLLLTLSSGLLVSATLLTRRRQPARA
jgi:putative spermidine/putrescine transport system permease protein